MLASAGNLTLVQVNNWFSNRRVRTKKRSKRLEDQKSTKEGETKGHGREGNGNDKAYERDKRNKEKNTSSGDSALSAILPLQSPSPKDGHGEAQ